NIPGISSDPLLEFDVTTLKRLNEAVDGRVISSLMMDFVVTVFGAFLLMFYRCALLLTDRTKYLTKMLLHEAPPSC
uniref:Uncharacterized protein n=1 Tax=Anopheles dirus TaxID=7168 RepID=A0A182NVT1_9DIPT